MFLVDPPKCHFWPFWVKLDLPTWWPETDAAKHDDLSPCWPILTPRDPFFTLKKDHKWFQKPPKIHENHGFWHGFGHLFDTSGGVLAPPNILYERIGTLWAHPPTSGQTPQKGCSKMTSKTSIFGHFWVLQNIDISSILRSFLITFLTPPEWY